MRGPVLRRWFRVRRCAQASRSSDFADARVCGGRILGDRHSRARRAEGTFGRPGGEGPRPESDPRAGTGAGSSGASARGMRRGTSGSANFARRPRHGRFPTGLGNGSISSCSRAIRDWPCGPQRHRKHGPPPTTTTSTTTSTTTTTTTTTTTATTTTGDDDHAVRRRDLRAGDLVYADAALVHAQPHGEREQRLSAPGGALQPAAGRSRPGNRELHSQRQTVINNRLSSPAELDLTGVQFVYSGGQNTPAVW